MAVCKHCGTEIEDGLKYCPNCGQIIENDMGDFFDADESLEQEAYNIFDLPEEFDMDSLLSKEFEQEVPVMHRSFASGPAVSPFEEPVLKEEPVYEEMLIEEPETISEPDIVPEPEPVIIPEPEPEPVSEPENIQDLAAVDNEDFFALDELFEDLDINSSEIPDLEVPEIEEGLKELLDVEEGSDVPKGKEKVNEKKKKRSIFQILFGNVPIDPSKVKPEPTQEQIAAQKEKEEEEKKTKAAAKKLAAEEKKQIAQKNKEEKARQKAFAKEEKKAKKLEEAKQILEEMKETRINRVGATIVFSFFTVCAIVMISGSEMFGYTVSIHSAEDNFKKAYNNNVKYYTDAYNDIYGLEIKPEDRLLSDKIMTVMFVNKELNSYNSHMVMKDYRAALHSLLLGLYRYGKYYEQAIPLGIDRDMDYVRTQILKELKSTFSISEDEAELLRSMLEQAGVGGMNAKVNDEAARAYNLVLYEKVKESGLNNDSNN